MTAKTESLGIGLIGAGLIGTLHAAALRLAIDRMKLPVQLVAVADAEPDKARRFVNAFKFKKAAADADELVRDPEVDAVYICTWTSAHAPLCLAAAAEKKHVFCEKPLAFTAGEAAAMQAAVESAGVRNQVGLVLRQGPLWNALRHEVQTRNAGFPITALFRDDQCFPIKGAHPSTWRKDPARAGAGTLIEHSIHDLDLLEWIFGPVGSIEARTACRFGHEGIEDLARVNLEFASGMTGALTSVWHDVLNRHSNRRVEVFFERVFFALESEFTGPLDIMEGEGKMRTVSESEVNQRFWELRGIEDPVERELSLRFGVWEDYLFLRSVLEGGRTDAPDFATAVRAHRLVDACYESARTGRAVKT